MRGLHIKRCAQRSGGGDGHDDESATAAARSGAPAVSRQAAGVRQRRGHRPWRCHHEEHVGARHQTVRRLCRALGHPQPVGGLRQGSIREGSLSVRRQRIRADADDHAHGDGGRGVRGTGARSSHLRRGAGGRARRPARHAVCLRAGPRRAALSEPCRREGVRAGHGASRDQRPDRSSGAARGALGALQPLPRPHDVLGPDGGGPRDLRPHAARPGRSRSAHRRPAAESQADGRRRGESACGRASRHPSCATA